MPHRFYVDEDLSNDLANGLGRAGIDAVHSREAGHTGASDAMQLMIAARLGRVLLTANAGHFRMLHQAWLIWSGASGVRGLGPHSGVVVVPNEKEITQTGLLDLVRVFERGIGAGDVRNRLFRYRGSVGWEDLSAVG